MTSLLIFFFSTIRYQYFMAVSPVDDSLLVSDPNSNKLYRLATEGPETGQLVTVAGTGVRCHDWEVGCGDGGLAIQARFTSLRGENV
jgi:hypothetical protein